MCMSKSVQLSPRRSRATAVATHFTSTAPTAARPLLRLHHLPATPVTASVLPAAPGPPLFLTPERSAIAPRAPRLASPWHPPLQLYELADPITRECNLDLQVNDAIDHQSLGAGADEALIVGFPRRKSFKSTTTTTNMTRPTRPATRLFRSMDPSADSKTGTGLLDGAVADVPVEFGRDVKLSEDGRTALVSGSAPPGQLRVYILNGTEWRQRGSTLEQ